LWRAVDDEGEVLDLVVPKRRDPSPIHTQMQSLTRCPWSQTLRAAH
jgi:hypothetical protein